MDRGARGARRLTPRAARYQHPTYDCGGCRSQGAASHEARLLRGGAEEAGQLRLGEDFQPKGGKPAKPSKPGDPEAAGAGKAAQEAAKEASKGSGSSSGAAAAAAAAAGGAGGAEIPRATAVRRPSETSSAPGFHQRCRHGPGSPRHGLHVPTDVLQRVGREGDLFPGVQDGAPGARVGGSGRGEQQDAGQGLRHAGAQSSGNEPQARRFFLQGGRQRRTAEVLLQHRLARLVRTEDGGGSGRDGGGPARVCSGDLPERGGVGHRARATGAHPSFCSPGSCF